MKRYPICVKPNCYLACVTQHCVPRISSSAIRSACVLEIMNQRSKSKKILLLRLSAETAKLIIQTNFPSLVWRKMQKWSQSRSLTFMCAVQPSKGMLKTYLEHINAIETESYIKCIRFSHNSFLSSCFVDKFLFGQSLGSMTKSTKTIFDTCFVRPCVGLST